MKFSVSDVRFGRGKAIVAEFPTKKDRGLAEQKFSKHQDTRGVKVEQPIARKLNVIVRGVPNTSEKDTFLADFNARNDCPGGISVIKKFSSKNEPSGSRQGEQKLFSEAGQYYDRMAGLHCSGLSKSAAVFQVQQIRPRGPGLSQSVDLCEKRKNHATQTCTTDKNAPCCVDCVKSDCHRDSKPHHAYEIDICPISKQLREKILQRTLFFTNSSKNC